MLPVAGFRRNFDLVSRAHLSTGRFKFYTNKELNYTENLIQILETILINDLPENI